MHAFPISQKKGLFMLQNPLAPQINYWQQLVPQQLYSWGKEHISFLFQKNSNRNHPCLVWHKHTELIGIFS